MSGVSPINILHTQNASSYGQEEREEKGGKRYPELRASSLWTFLGVIGSHGRE